MPRRDTNSRLNVLAGGGLFPGVQHHARFDVEEREDHYSVALLSDDGNTRVAVAGRASTALPDSSVFATLDEASQFFEAGSLGYSATATGGRFDGMELCCRNWRVEPLTVERIESSYFEDPARFPVGTVDFDCALLMRGIDHEWHSREDLCCVAT